LVLVHVHLPARLAPALVGGQRRADLDPARRLAQRARRRLRGRRLRQRRGRWLRLLRAGVAGCDGDRELALRLRRPAPGGGGRILVGELEPERPAARLRRGAADEPVLGEREAGRQAAAQDPELVGERRPAAAVAPELVRVGLADDACWDEVAVVGEADRKRGGRRDERDRERGGRRDERDRERGRQDQAAPGQAPTIRCTIVTSTGASSASAYPISAARIEPFAFSCIPGSPPASR